MIGSPSLTPTLQTSDGPVPSRPATMLLNSPRCGADTWVQIDGLAAAGGSPLAAGAAAAAARAPVTSSANALRRHMGFPSLPTLVRRARQALRACAAAGFGRVCWTV